MKQRLLNPFKITDTKVPIHLFPLFFLETLFSSNRSVSTGCSGNFENAPWPPPRRGRNSPRWSLRLLHPGPADGATPQSWGHLAPPQPGCPRPQILPRVPRQRRRASGERAEQSLCQAERVSGHQGETVRSRGLGGLLFLASKSQRF